MVYGLQFAVVGEIVVSNEALPQVGLDETDGFGDPVPIDSVECGGVRRGAGARGAETIWRLIGGHRASRACPPRAPPLSPVY
ncbi:hypothetical protein K1T71_003596 [Dendrolimus kikuchii]|uniref:Uncharacterized protein n=1 Tax=Dendrolimus kikuchii TaxID=765133 RepID=A0ACC1DCA1_9NEOP|nr:hypothetical protein K1T71_003596 [Dendrolimus kikuchii]